MTRSVSAGQPAPYPELVECAPSHRPAAAGTTVTATMMENATAIEIVSAPDSYVVDQEYPITVRLWSDSTAASPGRKWGFQFTAYRADDGSGAGTIELPDPAELQIDTGEPGKVSKHIALAHAAGA